MKYSSFPWRHFLAGLGIAGGISLLGATAEGQIPGIPLWMPALIKKDCIRSTEMEQRGELNGMLRSKYVQGRIPIDLKDDPNTGGDKFAVVMSIC